MLNFKIACCRVVLYAIAISGCCHSDYKCLNNCALCMINNSRVQHYEIGDRTVFSQAIDEVFNSMTVGNPVEVKWTVVMPEEGGEPTIGGFSAGDIATKDLLRLICGQCDYCYVIDQNGEIWFVPAYYEYVLPLNAMNDVCTSRKPRD